MALLHDPLVTVFREVFQNDQLEITNDSSFEDVSEWDSIGHVNLIATLEERFHVKFTTPEIVEMNSVGAIREILAAKSAELN